MATVPLPPADGLTYPLGERAPADGELIEVSPGIRWWRLPMWGPLKHVNGWLLDDGDGAVAVDTGPNTDAALAFWRALPDRLTRIVGSHLHPDHIGLAGWLSRRHGAPLAMTRGEWLTARMLIADAQDAVPAEQIAFWRAAGWSDEQVEQASARGWAFFARLVSRLPLGYRRLSEGDVLSIGGSAWRVVTGCGHSPEHACLLDEDRRVLIAGDQLLPRISSNISLGVTEPEGDPLGDWLASLARLRRLDDDLLVLPGHGEPFRGLHARADALAAEHRDRLDRLHAHLAEPRLATDCFPVLFRRPIGGDVLGLATGEALAHLRRLEREGLARREERYGRWWFHRT